MSGKDEVAEIDLDVEDVRHVGITTDPQGETIISLEMPGRQFMNLVFAPAVLAKLEAHLAEANQARAKSATLQ